MGALSSAQIAGRDAGSFPENPDSTSIVRGSKVFIGFGLAGGRSTLSRTHIIVNHIPR
ncbi:hypothetical protein M413DRAFT_448929 [Hebeloma cylindrosporum]|uniref:Uncharacterized protein n=1 Tax=Hebeloma cylindrosporum TaxID=76867 RepID=A0A0C3BJ94_HEBCY|nr:hypothetical protein M413DRAFT_448929 [Hebeloma cylindrosporum h7]